MSDKTDLRIETVNEYCIVNGKNQVVKDGFYSEEEAAEWLEEVYGVKHEPKAQLNLNEQVKELREIAKNWNTNVPINPVSVVLNNAADTIESLSAKLQAANMERSTDCEKSILKIETPKVCIDCPCHFAGESGMVMCGVEKRELLSDNIESYKPDWCPLRESADCGGWIPCKDRLPEGNGLYLVTLKNKAEGFSIIDTIHYINGWDMYGIENEFDVIAWRPLPEPYHES